MLGGIQTGRKTFRGKNRGDEDPYVTLRKEKRGKKKKDARASWGPKKEQ